MAASDWKRNLPLRTRLRVELRDAWVRHVRRPLDIFRRRHGLAEGEWFKQIKIQTNYTCTRRCAFCHYGQAERPRPVTMPTELFAAVIGSLAEAGFAGSLGIFEINEPLTDGRIVDLHALARRRLPRAWLYLASNGDLLDRSVTRELFASGLNILYLNSYDQPARERNLAFLDGLEPELRGRIHHMDRTYQDDWESRGGNLERYRRQAVMAPCDMVYNLCYVKPAGTVHPCINDFHDKVVLGDVNREPLMDIWRGEAMRALRRSLNAGDRQCNGLCARCDYPGYRSAPKIPLRWRLGL